MPSPVLALMDASSSVVHSAEAAVPVADLAADGRRLADRWRRAGLEPGDRVAVHAHNGLPYVRILAACAAGPFVLVSVNRRYAAAEAASLVARSGARLLVTDRTDLAAVGVEQHDVGEYRTLPDAGDTAVVAAESGADDPFIVFTTSGTTSLPKMVLHQQRSIADHAEAMAARLDAVHAADATSRDGAPRSMVALPLCGVFGLCSFTAAVAGRGPIWLPAGFDAEDVSSIVATEAITVMHGSDDMFHRMLATDHDLSSLRVAGYGRFNPSLSTLVERADDRGVRLTGLYGMSEVQALFGLRDPSEDVVGRSRAGGAVTSPRAEFRVVDPDSGGECPVGVDGELWLRGPSLFAGYLAEGGDTVDEPLTDGAHGDLDGRRWFRTGDLARREADGTFTYLTRMGDVLRLGGHLVHPSEIESVVLEIDGITEAVAVAVAESRGVRCAVVVTADHEPDVDAVIEHCRARLARFKVPVTVLRVDELPTTPSANGTKIRVTDLRALVEAHLATP